MDQFPQIEVPANPWSERDRLRTERDLARQALDRAGQLLADARDAVERLAAIDEGAATAHASRVTEWLLADGAGPAPELLVDVGHAAERQRAERALAAATRVEADLKVKLDAAEAAVAGADRTVREAVDAKLIERARALARDIQQDEETLLRKRARLLALDMITNPLFAPHEAVATALRAPEELTTGRYAESMIMQRGQHTQIVATADADWRARIARLLESGTDAPDTETP